MVTVQDIMHSDVKTISSKKTLRDVWKLFTKKHYNSAPVVDKELHLICIITKQDMLKLLYPDNKVYSEDLGVTADDESSDSDFQEMMNRKVSTVMHKNVFYTNTSTHIMRALARIIAHGIDQLPVVNDNAVVVGIVTKGDIFKALYYIHKNIFRKKRKLIH